MEEQTMKYCYQYDGIIASYFYKYCRYLQTETENSRLLILAQNDIFPTYVGKEREFFNLDQQIFTLRPLLRILC
jgi:hypothetical protein